jgi:hypothetical protein
MNHKTTQKTNKESRKYMDKPHDIITTAEQLLAELWEAKKAEEAEESQVVEEPVENAPLCAEAVEDEVRMLEFVINADLRRRMERDNATHMGLHARILEVARVTGAAITLWNVGACVEGHCGAPDCTRQHHNPKRFLITKHDDGTYTILDHEGIYDALEQNKECFEPEGFQGAVKIDIKDLIEGVAKKTVEAIAEEMLKSEEGPEDDDDDDDLPPAAIVEEAEPAEPASTPVVNVSDYRIASWLGEEQPGMLRRAWNWLRRR